MRASSPKAVVEKRSEANEASGVLGKGPKSVPATARWEGVVVREGHTSQSHTLFPPTAPPRLPPAQVDKLSSPTLTTLSVRTRIDRVL